MILISVLKFLKGPQLLNATCVSAASGWFLWKGSLPAAATVLGTVIFAVTKIHTSE